MKTEPDYPRRPGFNTTDLLMKLVMSLLLLALVMVATSCAALRYQPDSWNGTPNPLDPVGGEPTAAELHEENMRAITSNPGYRLP